MHLTKKGRFVIIAIAAMILAGCTPSSSSSPSTPVSEQSSVNPTLAISDVSIRVGDHAPLDIVFTPPSMAGRVEYANFDSEIIEINNDVVFGKAVGSTTVSAASGSLTTTFQVSVAEYISTDPVEEFNTYGEIKADLPGFVLTGDNLEHHIVENDNDRAGHEEALRIYVDDASNPAINFTLTSTYSPTARFLRGDYTISVEMVGNPDEVVVTILEEEYKLSDGEVDISSGTYVTSYFEFSLDALVGFHFSIAVSAAEGKGAWGYIDNIVMHNGHIKPDIIESDNLLKDGGFEELGKLTDITTSDVWGVEKYETAGDFSIWPSNEWAFKGSYSMKVHYWPNIASGAPRVEGVFRQTFTVSEEKEYALNYVIATGGLPDSSIALLKDGFDVQRISLPTTTLSSYSPQILPSLTLEAGEYTLVVHVIATGNTWAHFDEMEILPL